MPSEVTTALFRHGYDAVSTLRGSRAGADWFTARMLGRKALVVRGEEGVRLFYDPDVVTRRGAIPAPLRLLLFGPGPVHGLDGDRHRERKQIFLDVVDDRSAARLAEEVDVRLAERLRSWPGRPVRLFPELVEVYGAAVLAWAGVDVGEEESRLVSRELATVVDGFGVRGTPYPRAALARVRTQRWARHVVRETRRGRRTPPTGSALERIARTGLSDLVAATELLNVLRPTVAVAYFGTFAAHALDAHPDWRPRLATGDPAELRGFEHEIRRLYPFVPLLTGRLRRDLTWHEETFRRGGWIVLDVRGTNQDERSWRDADSFCPRRFEGREPNQFEYVPHGGGDPAEGHRCPGEPLAVGILEVTLRRLATLDFRLADADVPLRRIPSLPPGGLVLTDVRPRT